MNNKFKTAFTLIELLVVIAIIGILSGLIIVGMSSSVNNAKIAKAQIFSASLRDSMMANLVSEWKFDGSGITDGGNLSGASATTYTRDTWGNNHCTIGDIPLVYSENNCVYGSCLYFDGTNDYLNCGNNSTLNMTNAMTLEIWIKPATLTQTVNPEIICKAGGATDYRMRFIDGGGIGARFYGTSSSSPNSSSAIQAGVFTHVAIVYTGSANLIYFNGTIITSQANSGNITPTTGALFFASNSGTGEYFNGTIDNIRLYSIGISTSKIQEQYFAGVRHLLSNNVITKSEYQNKLSELANSLARKQLDAQNQLH